jgi:pyruvate kinase
MCVAGMNVARLNFSHGTYDEQQNKMNLIKKVRKDMNLPIAIMLDTKGPEYRIGTFETGKITLTEGDEFTFTAEDIVGDAHKVSVSYKHLAENLAIGDTILVSNGLLSFEVIAINGADVVTKVLVGGALSDRKSMNFPGRVMKQDFLSEQDKKDLLFGIQNDIDFVAASFVSSKADVAALREFLNENGGNSIEIIAKIENRSGVDNVKEICEIADGIMIARGDLGVEIPAIEVPSIQKKLIQHCRRNGTRVITATEMLESMITNQRPTRAEVSDVANAVYDGTSAVMLSGESASGKYPVEAVQNMAATVKFTEEQINYEKRFKVSAFDIQNTLDAISHAICSMAIDVHASCIVVNSLSGKTARMVSRYRCPVDILGMTTTESMWRKLNLSWGVTPVLCQKVDSMEEMFDNALESAENIFSFESGDNIVLTGGLVNGLSGNTNLIKVETVK